MRVYAYRTKYLCTTCLISLSRIWQKDVQMKCGRCASNLAQVHHKFRAPPSSDVKFWKVIQFLEASGSIDLLNRRHIPKSLREAEEMIAEMRVAEIANASLSQRLQKREKRLRIETVARNRQRAAKQRRWRNLSLHGSEEVEN